MNGNCRIRTPKGLVRSLSKKRSSKSKSSLGEDLGLTDDGMPMGSADDESVEAPESSVLVIKELDLARDQKASGSDDSNEQKVAELDVGLKAVKNEFEEFKRTSSMERDALQKELDVMKSISDREKQEEAEKKKEAESEKGGMTGVFCGLADIFDDEGYMKCCLPSDVAK